jgi:hypothetical protein
MSGKKITRAYVLRKIGSDYGAIKGRVGFDKLNSSRNYGSSPQESFESYQQRKRSESVDGGPSTLSALVASVFLGFYAPRKLEDTK